MDAALLAALAEPNRLRIVELLNTAPRAVGEVAAALGLRQPQATKHLQTLERAGLVTMHPLGRRRIYALRREPLRELRAWLAGFDAATAPEDVLARYGAAIDAERALLEREGGRGARTIELERTLPAPPAEVWPWWTSAGAVRRWWAPDHFTVADCTVEPVVGGRLAVVMEEGDGTRHRSSGRFLALRPPAELTFELAPLGPGGDPLFEAVHEVRLAAADGGTKVMMSIGVTGAGPEAAPALAGMRPGWSQLLDRLARELSA